MDLTANKALLAATVELVELRRAVEIVCINVYAYEILLACPGYLALANNKPAEEENQWKRTSSCSRVRELTKLMMPLPSAKIKNLASATTC